MPYKPSKPEKQVTYYTISDHNMLLVESMLLFLYYSAPTAPPDSFSISRINSRNVTLSWNLPNDDGRNGMILSYTATCSNSESVLINTFTTVGLSTTVDGLSPYSFYSCSVFATTGGGDGPAATLNFTTASDGKYATCNEM